MFAMLGLGALKIEVATRKRSGEACESVKAFTNLSLYCSTPVTGMTYQNEKS